MEEVVDKCLEQLEKSQGETREQKVGPCLDEGRVGEVSIMAFSKNNNLY